MTRKRKKRVAKRPLVTHLPRVVATKRRRNEPEQLQKTRRCQKVTGCRDSINLVGSMQDHCSEKIRGRARLEQEQREGATRRVQSSTQHPRQSLERLSPPLQKPVLAVAARRLSGTSTQHELFYLKHLKDTTK